MDVQNVVVGEAGREVGERKWGESCKSRKRSGTGEEMRENVHRRVAS